LASKRGPALSTSSPLLFHTTLFHLNLVSYQPLFNAPTPSLTMFHNPFGHLPGSAPGSGRSTPVPPDPPHGSIAPGRALGISTDVDVPFRLVPDSERRKRLVVGVTGATGTSIAIRLLQALRALDIETHLILSKWAIQTMKYETDFSVEEVGGPDNLKPSWLITLT